MAKEKTRIDSRILAAACSTSDVRFDCKEKITIPCAHYSAYAFTC